MSEGFTPGPWALRRSRTGSGHTHIECPADESMALFKRAEDARLFIAAPELLEALEAARTELLAMIDMHNQQNESDGSWLYDYQTIVEADAAIAKARGTPC